MNSEVCSDLRRAAIALLAAVVLPMALPGGASAHKIVGHDGMVHACYRVKGKPKGAVRLVHTRSRCHKGERKVAWPVAGPIAQTGATGAAGADATIAGLTERVDALTTRIEKLEGLLGSICSQISLVTSLLPIEPFSCP